MFSFKGFTTQDRNTHLEHLEDDIINRGTKGGEKAINFLKSIRNMLAGSSNKKVNMTVKWDGAPAIICGTNPENGKFFVGTKSVFNKNPKINYTNADIRKNHSGELATKLTIALRELSRLGIKGVLQGDLGTSIAYFPEPVSAIIGSGLYWTLFLAGCSLIISFTIGTVLGIIIAWNRT